MNSLISIILRVKSFGSVKPNELFCMFEVHISTDLFTVDIKLSTEILP